MRHLASLTCMECPHRGHGFFCELAGEALRALDRRKQAFTLVRGETLFEEGETIRGIHYIVRGLIKLYKQGEDGQRTITRLAGPGEMLGSEGLFAGRPHGATAEAIEESAVCLIDRTTFQNLALSTPAVFFSAAAKLGRRLGEAEKMLFAVGLGSVGSRLVGWLLSLHRGEAGHVNLPLTREEIAQLLCTTPETVMRMLGQLRQEGLITVDGRRIGLVDRRRLQVLAKSAEH